MNFDFFTAICMTLEICSLIFILITLFCMMFEGEEMLKRQHILKVTMIIIMLGVIVELMSFSFLENPLSTRTRYIHSMAFFSITLILFLTYIVMQQTSLRKKSIFLKIQNERLQAFASIYHSMHMIDLDENSVTEFKTSKEIDKYVDKSLDAVEMMRTVVMNSVVPEYLPQALDFTDLTTISDRLKDTDSITAEFMGKNIGWFKGRFVVIERDENHNSLILIFATVIIQSEKTKEENLIHISRTDELTNINNRRALEETLKDYDNNKDKEVAIVSLDINGLKTINDTLGHAAGDELILGATQCMKETLSRNGNLYRIGGDEFIALMNSDKISVATSLKAFQNKVDAWKGNKAPGLSVSFGFVTRADFPDKTMEELVILADRKMYEMKKQHYMEKTFDRRNR